MKLVPRRPLRSASRDFPGNVTAALFSPTLTGQPFLHVASAPAPVSVDACLSLPALRAARFRSSAGSSIRCRLALDCFWCRDAQYRFIRADTINRSSAPMDFLPRRLLIVGSMTTSNCAILSKAFIAARIQRSSSRKRSIVVLTSIEKRPPTCAGWVLPQLLMDL